jgi:predicted naringenin-chalcone synthase
VTFSLPGWLYAPSLETAAWNTLGLFPASKRLVMSAMCGIVIHKSPNEI